MKQIFISLSLFLLLFLGGCEKSDEYIASPHENFEALWKILDENYCFFEFKDIDWNEVHDRYKPQIIDTMNQYSLFNVLGNMLNELKDGHTNLISTFNMSRYWDWYLDYPDNFYPQLLDKYLGRDYSIAGGLKYRTFCDNQIGYIYYGSFSSAAAESSLDHIFFQFKECKGLILDIRDNGGGILTLSDRIASRFLEEKILTGYIQHKTGKGHNDFSEPHPVYLEPSSRIRWLRPVIVLTNRHCYSSANDFIQKVNLIPHVTTMGDRTGGGSGFPFNSELPNGWAVRFSSSPMLDVNKKHTEFGIDPQYKVSITEEDLKKGKDTIIEAAIAHLQEIFKKNEDLEKKSPEKFGE